MRSGGVVVRFPRPSPIVSKSFRSQKEPVERKPLYTVLYYYVRTHNNITTAVCSTIYVHTILYIKLQYYRAQQWRAGATTLMYGHVCDVLSPAERAYTLLCDIVQCPCLLPCSGVNSFFFL